MPQMSPILWMVFFVVILVVLAVSSSLMYFHPLTSLLNKSKDLALNSWEW